MSAKIRGSFRSDDKEVILVMVKLRWWAFRVLQVRMGCRLVGLLSVGGMYVVWCGGDRCSVWSMWEVRGRRIGAYDDSSSPLTLRE